MDGCDADFFSEAATARIKQQLEPMAGRDVEISSFFHFLTLQNFGFIAITKVPSPDGGKTRKKTGDAGRQLLHPADASDCSSPGLRQGCGGSGVPHGRDGADELRDGLRDPVRRPSLELHPRSQADEAPLVALPRPDAGKSLREEVHAARAAG
eukprot:scaffold895_cov315-Pinguiococcus_pyrenoidosus.AAC.3